MWNGVSGLPPLYASREGVGGEYNWCSAIPGFVVAKNSG